MERAHAKINLHLHVVGRRDDGYHLLDSLAVFAGAHDRLAAQPDPQLSLSVGGRFGGGLAGGDPSDNLVLRAARLLAEATGREAGAALHLDKELPVASGIGGGSADAAAALRLLMELWEVRDLPRERLEAIALRLGADVPVCLRQRPALMGGVGEVLRPAPAIPSCGLLLVNPGIGVSTPSVFRARSPGFREPAALPERWEDAAAMASDLRRLHNDLEAPARALCPPIDEVLSAIASTRGCLLARMSGSGATCFGVYESEMLATAAAVQIGRAGWWVWSGTMLAAS